MQVINVEEVRNLQARQAEINAIPFEDIEWQENGQPIAIHPLTVEDWKFIGLSNVAFVEFGLCK